MAEKTVKSRIQVKRGTSEEWGKATTFVPKEGEIIFYSDLNKIKIGDGKTLVGNLQFLHYTESEIDTKLADKVAVVKAINGGSGSFSKTTKYLHKTTTNVAPNAHTHNVTVSGTTGANSGTAVTALTGVKASSTDTFVKNINAGSGSLEFYADSTTTTAEDKTDGRIPVVTSISSTKASASGTAKAGSETHTHNYDKTTGVSLTANTSTATGRITYVESISGGSGSLTTDTTSTNGIKYVESISSTKASASGTAKAGSETHTHTYDKATGINLGSNTTADGGIAYVESVTHTAATLGGTKTFNTNAIKSVTLSASDTSTDGPKYVQEISGTKPSLTGTTTFITGYSSFSGGSGSLVAYDASTNGNAKTTNGNRIPFITSLSKDGYTPAGSVTLTAGTAPSMNFNTGTNTDTPYISALTNGSYTPAGSVSLTDGTAPSMGAATTKYLHFSAGTTPPKSASFSGTAATITPTLTGSLSGTCLTLGITGASYTPAGSVTLTAGTAPSLTADTTASGGIQYVQAQGTFSAGTTPKKSASFSGTATTALVTGGTTKYMKFSAGTTPKSSASFSGTKSTAVVTGGTTYYLAHGHSGASLGTASTSSVGIKDGEYTATTKYMKATGNAAGTGTVTISGGSITPTTKYFHPSITTTSTASGAPSATTSFVTGVTGGTASATTKYLHHSHSGASATTKYLSAAPSNTSTASAGPSATTSFVTGVSGGATTATTRYLEHTHIAPSVSSSAKAVTAVAANGTASVAPSSHTHSYGSSTALTTGANSGSAVAAITGLTANTTSASGDITYLESATHTHTGASVSETVEVVKAK